ncbi:MAG: hypothetical protein WEB03_08715 [Nitriliruptor sp.]|uniref:hypothetical protein n=1 Tax=Nitriliruptor sp. TaxID=2448056 RepID=UPI0034A027D8
MITFDLLAALVAGLAGTIAMTAMMRGATAMGMTKMPSMALIQGTMFTADRDKANRIGFLTHVVMMGTIVFGIGYAALFTAFDDVSLLTGALVGLGHGIVAGLAMAMMGSMHPRMIAPTPTTQAQGDVLILAGGETTLIEPGLFAWNYGPMTPVGLVMGHVVFGAVVALVYTAIA